MANSVAGVSRLNVANTESSNVHALTAAAAATNGSGRGTMASSGSRRSVRASSRMLAVRFISPCSSSSIAASATRSIRSPAGALPSESTSPASFVCSSACFAASSKASDKKLRIDARRDMGRDSPPLRLVVRVGGVRGVLSLASVASLRSVSSPCFSPMAGSSADGPRDAPRDPPPRDAPSRDFGAGLLPVLLALPVLPPRARAASPFFFIDIHFDARARLMLAFGFLPLPFIRFATVSSLSLHAFSLIVDSAKLTK
mmetsp:Transcript_9803/g.34432  ORF Transcript_9803/g.34432 Transcript_9803/m.34432 type:complete len:257 (+) Transcript_9803:947-1717(+)